MVYKEKLIAAVKGFIVGDALGVPYEFEIREKMKLHPATDMIGFGTHMQPPGTWSDDSSMMLCVLENLIKGGNSKDLAQLFLRWYNEGYHSPYQRVFDIGNTTRAALERLKTGVPLSQSGASDTYSAGNGSLMRTVPYAFFEQFSIGMSRLVLEHHITHQLSICMEASFFYARLLRSLVEGSEKQMALNRARRYLVMGWRIVDHPDDFPENAELFRRLMKDDFAFLPENEIRSGGYVMDTLEAAIWCFMNTDSYKESVLLAVNLGGDTDTIAALTGALAAVYYGVESIPDNWLRQVYPIRIDSLLE